jgi:16S rRNA C1402 (ribose-2'-O) methylase RsmI
MPAEKFLRGTAFEILKTVQSEKLKGEFVLIINNK